MTDPIRAIADAVLYEGYLLWPYRRSAQKNQRRWTFGGVYPRAYSEAEGGNDPCVRRAWFGTQVATFAMRQKGLITFNRSRTGPGIYRWQD